MFIDAGAVTLDAFNSSSTTTSHDVASSCIDAPRNNATNSSNSSLLFTYDIRARQSLLRFARLCLESGLALQPDHTQTMGRLVKVYLELCDFASACQISQRIVGEFPIERDNYDFPT